MTSPNPVRGRKDSMGSSGEWKFSFNFSSPKKVEKANTDSLKNSGERPLTPKSFKAVQAIATTQVTEDEVEAALFHHQTTEKVMEMYILLKRPWAPGSLEQVHSFLHRAAEEGRALLTKKLLELHFDPNHRNEEGHTSLDCVVKVALAKGLNQNLIDVAKLLHQEGKQPGFCTLNNLFFNEDGTACLPSKIQLDQLMNVLDKIPFSLRLEGDLFFRSTAYGHLNSIEMILKKDPEAVYIRTKSEEDFLMTPLQNFVMLKGQELEGGEPKRETLQILRCFSKHAPSAAKFCDGTEFPSPLDYLRTKKQKKLMFALMGLDNLEVLVKQNDLEGVKQFLPSDKKKLIHRNFSSGEYPLQYCLEHNLIPIAEELVNAGANLNHQQTKRMSPAVFLEKHPEIEKQIPYQPSMMLSSTQFALRAIERGDLAELNYWISEGITGASMTSKGPLVAAVLKIFANPVGNKLDRLDLLDALIKAGPNPKRLQWGRETFLEFAEGCIHSLEQDPRPYSQHMGKELKKRISTLSDEEEMITLEPPKWTMEDRHGKLKIFTDLVQMCFGQFDVALKEGGEPFQNALKNLDIRTRTLLMWAGASFDEKRMIEILKAGGNPLDADEEGITLYHIAAMIGGSFHAALVKATPEVDDSILCDNNGYTPYHYLKCDPSEGMNIPDEELTESLKKDSLLGLFSFIKTRKGNIFHKSDAGETPFFVCAQHDALWCAAVISSLARTNNRLHTLTTPNRKGHTPAAVAEKNGHYGTECLIRNWEPPSGGPQTDGSSRVRRSARDLLQLMNAAKIGKKSDWENVIAEVKKNPNILLYPVDSRGNTPLHIALAYGAPHTTIKVFLRYGAPLEVENSEEGIKPERYISSEELKCDLEVRKLLIQFSGLNKLPPKERIKTAKELYDIDIVLSDH